MSGPPSRCIPSGSGVPWRTPGVGAGAATGRWQDKGRTVRVRRSVVLFMFLARSAPCSVFAHRAPHAHLTVFAWCFAPRGDASCPMNANSASVPGASDPPARSRLVPLSRRRSPLRRRQAAASHGPAASPRAIDPASAVASAPASANRLITSRTRGAVVKARVVRHSPRSAPLGTHLDYLRRDGVTRDGEKARLFGPGTEDADGRAFAERCGDDRHHFRFIVSPDDAPDMSDLRSFIRDLVGQMEKISARGSTGWPSITGIRSIRISILSCGACGTTATS